MQSFARSLGMQARFTSRRHWSPCVRHLMTDADASPMMRKRKFGIGTAFLCTIPFVTFGLGTWQVQRLRWKVDLIERLEERMYQSPIPLPRRISDDAQDEYEYRRVSVQGEFIHDQEMLLGPRTRGDGNVGYFIITPLRRPNGTTILVKRGWVSSAKRDPHSRPESLVKGQVTIEGLLRMSEKRNTFTPDNVPERNQWYWTDIQTMAEQSYAQPILVEQVSDTSPYREHGLVDKGIPVGRSPVVEVRNSHFQYIVTWYALSLATTVMLWRLLKKPVNRPIKSARKW